MMIFAAAVQEIAMKVLIGTIRWGLVERYWVGTGHGSAGMWSDVEILHVAFRTQEAANRALVSGKYPLQNKSGYFYVRLITDKERERIRNGRERERKRERSN